MRADVRARLAIVRARRFEHRSPSSVHFLPGVTSGQDERQGAHARTPRDTRRTMRLDLTKRSDYAIRAMLALARHQRRPAEQPQDRAGDADPAALPAPDHGRPDAGRARPRASGPSRRLPAGQARRHGHPADGDRGGRGRSRTARSASCAARLAARTASAASTTSSTRPRERCCEHARVGDAQGRHRPLHAAKQADGRRRRISRAGCGPGRPSRPASAAPPTPRPERSCGSRPSSGRRGRSPRAPDPRPRSRTSRTRGSPGR